MLRISDSLEIPDAELVFVTSRSSGPGGQNVNKVDTRVTLLFNVAASPSLSEHQRALVRERLAGRTNREGIMRVTSQRHRTQSANREAVVERFVLLVREALTPQAPRIPLKIPAGANERRLDAKRRRQRIKRERSLDLGDED